MARLRRSVAGALTVLVGGLLLSACGGTNGDAMAACRGVDRAVAHYQASLRARSPSVRANDQAAAVAALDQSEQAAALANSSDGTYNALMTLLQEANAGVPLPDLMPSLTRTCHDLGSPESYP